MEKKTALENLDLALQQVDALKQSVQEHIDGLERLQVAISNLPLQLRVLYTSITSATSNSGTETGGLLSPTTKHGKKRRRSTLVEPPGLIAKSTGGSSEYELPS
ncbi:hypothetical protein LCGC14_0428500 [marine sediment metagenome]|uniref:Uncharacterized protein n=1 Tax=marine sediment metagenome TaxID=412755 RepID=A0A0F9SNR4_9ZZZZ